MGFLLLLIAIYLLCSCAEPSRSPCVESTGEAFFSVVLKGSIFVYRANINGTNYLLSFRGGIIKEERKTRFILLPKFSDSHFSYQVLED